MKCFNKIDNVIWSAKRDLGADFSDVSYLPIINISNVRFSFSHCPAQVSHKPVAYVLSRFIQFLLREK